MTKEHSNSPPLRRVISNTNDALRVEHLERQLAKANEQNLELASKLGRAIRRLDRLGESID